MTISIIAAMGKNRELGLRNQLLWHLPDDLKRFKQITRGHAIIMGRKTYESIGKPLPERKNIILTRNVDFLVEGCIVVRTIKDAFKVAESDDEVFVIGGAEIYKLALPYADKLYLTFVDAAVGADTYFPAFDENDWHLVESEPHEVDDKHPYKFIFKIYEKKS